MRDNEQILSTIGKADKALRQCLSELLAADASANTIRNFAECIGIVEDAACALGDGPQIALRGAAYAPAAQFPPPYPPINIVQQNYCQQDEGGLGLPLDEFEDN